MDCTPEGFDDEVDLSQQLAAIIHIQTQPWFFGEFLAAHNLRRNSAARVRAEIYPGRLSARAAGLQNIATAR
jgi:hypothetical protein